MSAIAIIPARAGSRGVPGKNFRICAGKPLLAWSIEAALEAVPLVQRIVVSSDAPQALEIAESYDGVEFLQRPADLATDDAMTDPVLVDALKTLAGGASLPDYVVLLQPTVPVRRPGLVRECVERVMKTGARSLLTAHPLHFAWRQREIPLANGKLEWIPLTWRRPRRQEILVTERLYHEDGSVYVSETEFLLDRGHRLGGQIEVVETERTVDVDTEADFKLAEWLLLERMPQDRPSPGVEVDEPQPVRRRRAR